MLSLKMFSIYFLMHVFFLVGYVFYLQFVSHE